MDSASECMGLPVVKRIRPVTQTDGPAQTEDESWSGRSQYPAHPTEAPAERAVLRSHQTDSRNGATSRVLSTGVEQVPTAWPGWQDSPRSEGLGECPG